MSTTFDPVLTASPADRSHALPAAAITSAKPLWVAVGVLSVAVLGMGGVLINQERSRTPPSMPATASVATPTAAVVTAPLDTPAAPAPAPEAKPPVVAKVADKPVSTVVKPVKVVSKPREPASVRVANAPVMDSQGGYGNGNNNSGNVYGTEPSTYGGRPVSAQPAPYYPPVSVAPVVVQAPARPVCLNCGAVESVTPVERGGESGGLGAIAGGVLGAVVGNQVGRGNGRTAAAILGALGGGFAGNAVEKNMKKTTGYAVRVRMEDGSLRTLEQASPLSAGERVVVENGYARPAPRAASAAPHSVVGAQMAPQVYTSD